MILLVKILKRGSPTSIISINILPLGQYNIPHSAPKSFKLINLYLHILLNIFISMLLTLKIVAIAVVAVVNAEETVVLAVVCAYCLLVRQSSSLSILWKFQLNNQINFLR